MKKLKVSLIEILVILATIGLVPLGAMLHFAGIAGAAAGLIWLLGKVTKTTPLSVRIYQFARNADTPAPHKQKEPKPVPAPASNEGAAADDSFDKMLQQLLHDAD